MGKYDKLLLRIFQGQSDGSIAFDDLCQLLVRLGFDERIRGSHPIFRKSEIEEESIYNVMATKPNPIKCVK